MVAAIVEEVTAAMTEERGESARRARPAKLPQTAVASRRQPARRNDPDLPSPAPDFQLGPVVLLGVPGAGKGTQAKRIIQRYGVPHVSTGDIFRDIGRSDTPLARQVRSFMEKGELVPDELVCETVAERLSQPDCRRGFVLDGFPRTLPQTEWLSRFLPQHGWVGDRGLIVIYLTVGYNDLYRRLAGRRSCPVCGKIYNDFTQPPRVAGACDLDGGQLVQRRDDDPDVIRERLIAYEEQTLPLVEHFRQHGRLVEICGTDPVERVTANIFGVLDRSRRDV